MRTIIAYVPALHKGYIDFFKSCSCMIHLLDLDLVREIPRLERDIRALDAKEARDALKGVGFNVHILNKEGLSQLDSFDKIILPDEDVSRHFAEEYLINRNVKFVPVFLRWEKHNSDKKNAVIPDGTVSKNEFDRLMMGKAFAEAAKSPDWWRQIGAVAVKDGKVLLTGFNKPLPSQQVHNIFGDPRSNFDYGVKFEISKFIHAEAGIIAEAAKRGISLEGASLYVTTFPCPVCAKLVATAGIAKIYYSQGYSLLDAKDILSSFDIEIVRVES